MWFALIAGCVLTKEPDLVVGPLDSHLVTPGEDVQLFGDGLDAQVQVVLRADDGTEIPVQASVQGDDLRLTVPDSAPGAYTLVIRRGEDEDTQVITIADPADERPCQRRYQANTGIDAIKGIGFVDRFYPDGRRERVEIPLVEVQQLEYAYDDAAPCAAIRFRKTDGSAVLFEDSDQPLAKRALTLGEFTGKPVRGL